MIDAANLVPGADLLWIVLDTLRYDVAQAAFESGDLPVMSAFLPAGGWERRHAPGSFTYASHQAMFSGFLPTPADPTASRERLFAVSFAGSETTGARTKCFHAADIISGLRLEGYHTVCIGGVGFFNQANPLGRVLPGLFDEAHWDASMGVTDPASATNQVACALRSLDACGLDRPCCLFVNIAALHQPNWFYHYDQRQDDNLDSHRAALLHVDAALAPLFTAVRERSTSRQQPCIAVLCSDHGTAYGEDGFVGHRCALPCIWDVPYAEALIR